MKREELKELGLSDEQLDAVMKMNGQSVEAERKKYADYDDIKSQLKAANDTLDGLKDYDDVKKQVAEYKAAAEKAQADAAAKVAELELSSKVNEFTSGKKFVNDFTKSAINSQLKDALKDSANAGKSLDDLFKTLVGEDMKNILIDEDKPTPPNVTTMNDKGGDEAAEDATIREVMGLPPLN